MTEHNWRQHAISHATGYNHRPFFVILLTFVLLTVTYSLVLPLGEAADEAEHFALIRFITEHRRPPLTLEEKNSISAKGDASPLYHSLVALLTQHVDVSSLPELPDPRHRLERAIPYDRLPFKGLYHTEDEAFPYRGIVLAWHLARLVSIPLGAATIIAIYVTILTILPGHHYIALGAASFAAFIPRFVINAAIVSDDNLVLPLIALSLYYLVRIAQGDERRRTFISLGLFVGLAAISKYHGLLLIPELTIVLLAVAWQKRWAWQVWLHRWGLTLLAFLLTSGWWFAFLIIRFNQVAELDWLRGVLAPLGDPVITAGVGRLINPQAGGNLGYETALSWFEWLGLLFRTFWFRYGRGHIIDNPLVNWGLAAITLMSALGLVSLNSRGWRLLPRHIRQASRWRLDIDLLALHFLIYLSIVVARFLSLPTRETAQGRHLYPALTAIAFFFVLGLSQTSRVFGHISSFRLGKYQGGWSSSAYDNVLAFGIGSLMLVFSLVTLPLFIIPVYYPYLPISRVTANQVPIQHRLQTSFAKGLDFEGFSLESSNTKVGQAVPLTLYWSARATQERDYLVKVCLNDTSGRPVTCHYGHPADGRYPMRAWEPGYLIRDEIHLPTPRCLLAGDYELTLALVPLRLDTATTTFKDTAKTQGQLSLGRVSLSNLNSTTSLPRLELWVRGDRYDHEEVELAQIRQAVTVIDYGSPAGSLATNDAPSDIYFLTLRKTGDQTANWFPATPEVTYYCPAGSMVTVHNFIVDPGVKPGRYQLTKEEQDNKSLQVNVLTRPRKFEPLAEPLSPLNASFAGQVELLDYNFDSSPRLPGDTVEIEVYWQTLNTMSRRYVGSVHLLDNALTMYGQIDHILGNDFEYPNVLWAPGEVNNQVFSLPIKRRTPPGLYTIEFGVYDYSAGDFDFLPITGANSPEPANQIHLGQIRVLDPARSTPPRHLIDVVLGSQIKLLGFDLSSDQLTAREPLHLALHWQAIDRASKDYTVFTQLVGPDGLVWAQQDNLPQHGRYPTTAWTLNDRIVDRFELTLQEGAPPGEYRLLVGMYDLATGQRLGAIAEDGTQLPDNAILLATLMAE